MFLTSLPGHIKSAVIVSALLAGTASAQPYPVKPVRVIVNFPPGAGTDISTRLVTAKLTEMFGQQFLVDNRPGAAGNIGVELAARAAPDGYTLLTATAAAAISQTLFSKISFDLNRDFTPVAMIASAPFVLAVHPSVPAKSLQELVALAKSRPGQLSYATPGTGSSPHLAGELLKMQAGIDLLHVPYKGMVPAITDVIGGSVSIIFGNTLVVLPNINSGRVRGIAITSARRSGIAPELPTVAESGFPGFEALAWNGVLVAANTPRPVIARLNAEINAVLKDPGVQQKMHGFGFDLIGGTPEDFGALISGEAAKWAPVIKKVGLKVD